MPSQAKRQAISPPPEGHHRTRKARMIPSSSTSLENGNLIDVDEDGEDSGVTKKGKHKTQQRPEDEDEDEEPSTVKKGKGKKKRKKIEEHKVEAKTGKGKEEDADPEVEYGFTDTSQDKNALRREARRRAAIEFPQLAVLQRQASGHAQSGMVAGVWADSFTAIAQREQAMQSAIAGHFSSLAIVQNVVDAYCSVQNLTCIPTTAAVWGTIPTRTLDLLAAIAACPTNWDVLPFLASGALVLSNRGDAPPGLKSLNYIRHFSVLGPMAVAALLRYLAANTIVQLILVGEKPEKIHQSFRAAMLEYGLEEAVDSFFNNTTVKEIVCVLARAPRLSTHATCFLYNRITHTMACTNRGWDDVERESNVRVVNLLDANPEVKWETYHFRDLNTPISGPLDMRTSETISLLERIVQVTCGAASLNSDHGGLLPVHLPSPEHRSVLDLARAFLPDVDPTPLGQDRDLILETTIRSRIDDEYRFLAPFTDSPINPAILEMYKQYAADVIRSNNGKIVKMEIAKDVPAEVYHGQCGAYWQATPDIPTAGDLSLDCLAVHVGATLNFWRLLLRHILYLLHVLFLSRLLGVYQPLIIVTQSNPVAAMMRSGDLVTVWDLLKPEQREQFEAGVTPVGMECAFPDAKYRTFRRGDFTAEIGTVKLIPTGRDPGQMALHIPHPHYGCIKYDSSLACPRWDVDLLVEGVVYVVTQMTAARLHDLTVAVDWTDPVQTRAWLEVVKGKAEEVLREAGVSQALEQAKNKARCAELVLNFLRQTRREGILATPRGRQRREQLDAILERARELKSFDLPPDPDHLSSFLHPILGDSFQEWFLSLKDGTDVVYASNALGQTEESHLAAQENQQAIGKWRRAHHVDVYVDQVVVLRKRLVKAVRETTGAGKVLIKDILSALRRGTCSVCGISVIGGHNAVAHKCPIDRVVRDLTGKNFRDMERVQYIHEILNNDEMLAALGHKADVLSEMALVVISAQTILDSQHHTLQSAMPHDYLSLLPFLTSDADIHVKEDVQSNIYGLLTLAVDTVLATKSQCPPDFLPLEFDSRDAWSVSQSEMLLQWFKSRSKPLYLVLCCGPPGTTLPLQFFPSTNITALLNGTLRMRGYNCKLCSSKTCRGRRFLKVNTLLDLPPHHARHIWMVHRRGSERVKALSSRKAVSRR
ncbi:hypothetical protein DFH07DRAFT_953852 [Mycena maculata]|uniref:Uncharacterized protein n=1 Tax=Mycena maculata TaxID=230809 RepID=A0AAD7JWG3_9AGAR|nr:hypothetical protein DFH07DRAFT_953852 [Mycena maculata]